MYKTPGVYVEEIPTLPPSVAEVSTAVPVFVGYTEKGSGIQRIDTMLEFEEHFGGPKRRGYTVAAISTGGTSSLTSITRDEPAGEPAFLLYHAVSHYFKNGGGTCYVASVGDYSTATPDRAAFEAALDEIAKEDEPTLIVLTDAVSLAVDDYYSLAQMALQQCAELGDRFVILDVLDGDVAAFRDKTGTENLMYGAAYHPYLQTTLTYAFDEADVDVSATSIWSKNFDTNGIRVTFIGDGTPAPEARVLSGTATDPVTFTISAENRKFTVQNVGTNTAAEVFVAWSAWKAVNDTGGFDLTVTGDGSGTLTQSGYQVMNTPSTQPLSQLRTTETVLYNLVKRGLAAERIVLPPSATIAGVYAAVDRSRGVWKAPANVSLASVIGPVSKISDRDQEDLNVDPTAGKSINAIRAFTGKGTLVWGARTLAGNDNEWRFISVRRLFNLIEESTRKSTAFAVFEPNDETTWLKVRGMIESYLYRLWEQGALAGSTPEQAYRVSVGLGKTMSAQDVLEGRMIVEIGVAASRPAEFIILRFTHKLQEA